MPRAFSLGDESFAAYRGGSSACEIREAEREAQSREFTDTLLDGAMTVGTAGFLGWYQGRSGGVMPKLLGLPIDLLAGIALTGGGLWAQYAEHAPSSMGASLCRAASGGGIDWGRGLTSAGFGAFAWYLGNVLHDVGLRSATAPAAPAPAPAPGVTTPGWNPMLGVGNRAFQPSNGNSQYVGYRRAA
jgi:hypothetical protein